MLLFRCLPILLLLLLPDRCGSLALSSGSFKRSYMRRRGQSTKAQKRAMRELWPKYGITLDTGRERSMLDTASIFGRSAPLILDIGHGHGESTVALSKTFSNCDVIGCEVHAPSVGATLLRLESENCSNVRLVRADIFDLMSRVETISGCFVGFPDPWPGARQSSIARRLIRPDFVRMIDQRLCVTSDLPPLSLATDDEEYAIHSRSVLAEAGWDEVYATNRFESRPYWRPISNYERKAMNASRVVWDLAFRPPNIFLTSLERHPPFVPEVTRADEDLCLAMEVDSASADERPASVPSQEVVEESAVEESAAPTQLDKDLKMDTPAVVEPAAPMESDQRQDTSSEQAEFEFDDENEIALDEDSDDEDSEEDVNAADLRLDDMEDVLPVSDAPPRTANEIVDLPAPEPPEKIVISAHCELLQVGNVSARIDEQLVVKGLENGKAVIEGTILCLGDRTPLGRVWEIFGPVRHPHYVVRTTVDMPPGEIVFAPQPEASFVDANYVSSSRGCDASNVHDEELPEHLQEFSDDEAQTDAKRTATKRPWESGEDHRQGEVSPGGRSAPSLPPSQVLGSCT